MDIWKFEWILAHAALYFRRCDKFEDPLEGRLSPKEVHGTSESEKAFRAAYPIKSDYESAAAAQEITRGCIFVNCWNMRNEEDARMWNGYTGGSDSLAIQSTVGQLRRAISDDITMSAVRYVPLSTPRIKFSELTVFFYKDVAFEYENELRLVRPLGDGEEVYSDKEEDFGKEIPFRPDLAICRVIMNKRISDEAANTVRSLCRDYCPGAAVELSRLEMSGSSVLR